MFVSSMYLCVLQQLFFCYFINLDTKILITLKYYSCPSEHATLNILVKDVHNTYITSHQSPATESEPSPDINERTRYRMTAIINCQV